MALRLYFFDGEIPAYTKDFTHNYARMFDKAGIFRALWRGKETRQTKAADIIRPLRLAVVRMEADPDYYRRFDAPNGWGTFDQEVIEQLQELIAACEKYPEAEIERFG